MEGKEGNGRVVGKGSEKKWKEKGSEREGKGRERSLKGKGAWDCEEGGSERRVREAN